MYSKSKLRSLQTVACLIHVRRAKLKNPAETEIVGLVYGLFWGGWFSSLSQVEGV